MRIYDTVPYRRTRSYLQRVHRSGFAVCVRCGLPIHPWQAMDVGHVEGDDTRIAGPEHRNTKDCPEGGNRATARHRVGRLRTPSLW